MEAHKRATNGDDLFWLPLWETLKLNIITLIDRKQNKKQGQHRPALN